jgi:hypothetical protein
MHRVDPRMARHALYRTVYGCFIRAAGHTDGPSHLAAAQHGRSDTRGNMLICHRSVWRSTLVLSAAAMYIMWAITFLAQLHPLISPVRNGLRPELNQGR